MKKIILILLVVLVFVGCTVEPDLGDWEYVIPEEEDDGRHSFLYQTDYSKLLNMLESESYIDKSVIASKIEELETDRGEYSIYISGNSVCHTFHWDCYSSYSYDWIYYVTVDIWVINGVLELSMCSYYN